MTPSLTMNVGLRWEYFGRPVERDDRIASFDIATGQQVFPGTGRVPAQPDRSVLQRLRPQGRRGVARRRPHGATGWIRDVLHPGCDQHVSATGVSGTLWRHQQRDVQTADPQNPLPVFTVDDPLTHATRLITNDRNGIQRDLRDGQVQQWTGSVQYLLTNTTLLEVAYHGSKSANLMGGLNYNETDPFPPQPPEFSLIHPYPQLGNVIMYESRGSRVHRTASAGRAPLGRRIYRHRLIHISADVDRSGCQQRRCCLRRGGTTNDQGHSRQLRSGAL